MRSVQTTKFALAFYQNFIALALVFALHVGSEFGDTGVPI